MTESIEQSDDIQTRAMTFAAQAAAFRVDGSTTYEQGIESLQRIARLRKSWDAIQRPAIKAAKHAHDEALKAFRTIDDKLADAYDQIKAECETWADQQRQIQRDRMVAYANQTPVDGLDSAFDQAVAAGDTAKAARILDQAALPASGQTMPPLPPVPSELRDGFVPKVDGASLTTPWTYDVLDESLVPREYLTLDRKKIAAVVKAMKQDTRIPGIHARPDTALRIRS